MGKYKFDIIAINSKAKKKPTEEDKSTYIGLEHLDSECLQITRFGSDVAPIGEKLLMKKGDILFGKRRAYQKKVGIAPFDGIFSAHGMVLRPNEDVIHKDFFPFFISSNHFLDDANKISVGSLSPTINWNDLKELYFNLPSMEEQKKLAKVLWAAETTRQKYKQLLKKIDELVKSTFVEMFEGKGNISKQWQQKQISDVCDLQMGKTPSRDNPTYWGSKDYSWVSIADMSKYEKYTTDTNERISQRAIDETGIKLVPNNTVIMSFKLSIGKTAITSETLYTNEAIMAFIEKDTKIINTNYLYYILSIKDWAYGVKKAVKGATLNKESLKKMTITIPPLILQEKFISFLEHTDNAKSELQKTLDNLNAMTKVLIQKNLIQGD